MLVDLNVVFLILAVFSIVLSLFAIWQANEHKKEAGASERAAQDALRQLKDETAAFREYAIPELKSYGDAMREFMFKAEVRSKLGLAAYVQSPAAIPEPRRPSTPVVSPPTDAVTETALRKDISQTISRLRSEKGKAQLMDVFSALEGQYEFGVILGEIITLRDEGVLRWTGDQSTPQPYAGVELV